MNLVLLTSSYPYGDKEAFLEAEINTLSKRFSHITILSYADTDVTSMRKVPDNVTTVRVKDTYKPNYPLCITSLFKVRIFKDLLFTSKIYGYKLKNNLISYINFYETARIVFMPYLNKFDVENTVFYSYWFSHLSYALACFKNKNPNAICVTRAHRFDNFIDWNVCNMREFILRNIDGVFPISEEGAKEIQTKMLPYFPKVSPKIEVHHLGVTIPEFNNPEKEGNDSTFYIASCSYVWHIKRIDILIDALSGIDGLDVSWVHFGSGNDFEKMKALAKERLGKKKNIHYDFKGLTPHDEILKYYENNHIDLFANMSDHEGIPVSIMEAMASGIIAVARNVGGNKELVINGETGYLLNSDANSEDYRKTIIRAANEDAYTLQKLKKNGTEYVKKNFSKENVYGHFVDCIMNLTRKD